MLDELKRPLRGRPDGVLPSTRVAEQWTPHRSLNQNFEAGKSARNAPNSNDANENRGLLARLPLPPRLLEGATPELVRASVPLSLSGFSAGVVSELKEALAPFNITALAAVGGAGRPEPRVLVTSSRAVPSRSSSCAAMSARRPPAP